MVVSVLNSEEVKVKDGVIFRNTVLIESPEFEGNPVCVFFSSDRLLKEKKYNCNLKVGNDLKSIKFNVLGIK